MALLAPTQAIPAFSYRSPEEQVRSVQKSTPSTDDDHFKHAEQVEVLAT
jgi:hypothetical protein